MSEERARTALDQSSEPSLQELMRLAELRSANASRHSEQCVGLWSAGYGQGGREEHLHASIVGGGPVMGGGPG